MALGATFVSSMLGWVFGLAIALGGHVPILSAACIGVALGTVLTFILIGRELLLGTLDETSVGH